MAATKSFATTTALLMFVIVFPARSHGNTSFVVTSCGREIPLQNPGPETESFMVNLTFGQPQPNGASCSWVIPAGNVSMSNQVMLIGTADSDALACDKNPFTFSVSERNPDNGALSPLTLECMETPVSHYKPVVGQPGFSMVVTLNTTSALSESFVVMHVLPFVWSDAVCPRGERRVVWAGIGSKDVSHTFSPSSVHLLSRFPDNIVCRWELKSSDDGRGVIHLIIRTFLYNSNSSRTCGTGDHFVVSDGNRSSAPHILPLCEDPGVYFQYTSMTGSILVDMVSDDTGGAYQSFYLQYWSIESCPASPLGMEAYLGEQYRLKGSSYSPWGSEFEQVCLWQIRTLHDSVVQLYKLEAQDFEQNCDDTKDYLVIDSQKVSICNSSQFPVWSETDIMDVRFHTIKEQVRRSFVLSFTAVLKSPCQGYPERRTISPTIYRGEYVVLMPIPLGDVRNGFLCQWIFTAKNEENTVKVAVDWAEMDSDDGVPFDQETCSFSNFAAYSGEAATPSALITPTCSADKSAIIYKSTSRDMLFVYQRDPGVAESGLVMEVNQVLATGTGSSASKDGLLLGWRMALTGLLVFMLADFGRLISCSRR